MSVRIDVDYIFLRKSKYFYFSYDDALVLFLFFVKSSTSGSRMEGGRLRGDGGASSDDDSLTRQNVDLRQRLQEEATAYKRRLDTYRQAQQNQAALVSRLQAKVKTQSYPTLLKKILFLGFTVQTTLC